MLGNKTGRLEDIIADQRKTIYRLQDECTSKTTEILMIGQQLKSEKERTAKYEKGFEKLLEIVEPHLSDFTGITDDGEFDLILAVEELIQQYSEVEKENKILRQYRESKQASYEAMQKLWKIAEDKRRELECKIIVLQKEILQKGR